ncbi:hypothetical protein ACFLX5_05025 [Chloroflexota bacterium]
MPQIAKTIRAVRERLGVPIDALENAAISVEQDVQHRLAEWFGRPSEGTEAVEVDKAA